MQINSKFRRYIQNIQIFKNIQNKKLKIEDRNEKKFF